MTPANFTHNNSSLPYGTDEGRVGKKIYLGIVGTMALMSLLIWLDNSSRARKVLRERVETLLVAPVESMAARMRDSVHDNIGYRALDGAAKDREAT